MFFENHYQKAYVTRDIHEAMKVLTEQYRVERIKPLGGPDLIAGNRVWTPQGDVDLVMKTVMAYVGNVTYEIMEVVSDPSRIFADVVDPDRTLSLHHFGYRCDDVEKVRAEGEALGRPTVIAGGYGVAKFIYVDARATLGHYLEYVQAPADYWNR